MLDAGASQVFSVADHQLAHIYVQDLDKLQEVKTMIEAVPGVAFVLNQAGKQEFGLDHPRSGELVAVAEPDSWFTYYYWLDDTRAPDFARTVDIHRKPGYDPVELFVNPKLRTPKLRLAQRLLQKKLGFRYLMDVIPLDATLVKGSHGHLTTDPEESPIWMTRDSQLTADERMVPTAVHDFVLESVFV